MAVTWAILLGAMLVAGALRAVDVFNSRRPIGVNRVSTSVDVGVR